jgi:hypothetical protein
VWSVGIASLNPRVLTGIALRCVVGLGQLHVIGALTWLCKLQRWVAMMGCGVFGIPLPLRGRREEGGVHSTGCASPTFEAALPLQRWAALHRVATGQRPFGAGRQKRECAELVAGN